MLAWMDERWHGGINTSIKPSKAGRKEQSRRNASTLTALNGLNSYRTVRLENCLAQDLWCLIPFHYSPKCFNSSKVLNT